MMVSSFSININKTHQQMFNKKQTEEPTKFKSQPLDRHFGSNQNANDQLKNDISTIFQIIQYKNAIYFGHINAKNSKHGQGLIIYDSGDILIGQFTDDCLDGCFFYLLYGKNLCYYGKIKDQNLDGNCYVMNRNQKYIQRAFKQGHSEKGCFVFDRYKVSVVHCDSDLKIQKIINNDKRIKSYRDDKMLSFQPILITPTQFLQEYVLKLEVRRFKLLSLDRNQQYFGLQQNNKLHGYGIIFHDEWPVCYGNFEEGQLNGLGRVQQNKQLILDGLFRNNTLSLGWLINLKNNTTSFGSQILSSFGKQSKIGIQKIDHQFFQIKQQFSGILALNVSKFRRQQHIQSLKFINSYANVFPSRYLTQIDAGYLKYLQNPTPFSAGIDQDGVSQNFIPSFISQISRVNGRQRKGTTYKVERDLIEMIKQHNYNKNTYLKTSRKLEERLKIDIDTDETEEQGQYSGKSRKNKDKIALQSKINSTISTPLKNEEKGKNFITSGNMIHSDRVNTVQDNKIGSQNKYSNSDNKNSHSRVITQKKLNLHDLYRKYLKS